MNNPVDRSLVMIGVVNSPRRDEVPTEDGSLRVARKAAMAAALDVIHAGLGTITQDEISALPPEQRARVLSELASIVRL